MSMVLVCDLDGVIFDFDRAWTDRHRADFGSDLKPRMPQRWADIYEMSGLDRDAFWKWWTSTGGFASLPVHEGAREALVMAGHEGWWVIYATNRHRYTYATTLDALHEAGMPHPSSLVHTRRKWTLEADLFVEDAPENLMRMHEHGSATLRIERPWNRPEDYPELSDVPSIPDLTSEGLRPHLLSLAAGVP